MNNLRKAAAEAGTLFNRAKQFTEEKLGAAERTCYDPALENLINRSDSTKMLTERMISNTTSILQPNPNERLEDMVLTRLDRKVPKPNNLEVLGHNLIDAGHEIGFQYGATLAKVGEAEKKLGQAEKEFVQKSNDCFLQPLKSFLEGQMKTIQKEKKTLEGKRLDLDASKAKLKKLNENPSPKLDQLLLVQKTEDEVRRAQADFDRQCELTKLLMDELTTTYNHHLQCLTDFVDAQLNYYNSCSRVLQDLSKQIGGTGIKNLPLAPPGGAPSLNSGNAAAHASANASPTTGAAGAATTGQVTFFSALNGDDAHPSLLTKKQAKVLFDYEATDPSEISVSANQIITVQIVPNDNDWVLAETGRDSGKIPKAYIQIVD